MTHVPPPKYNRTHPFLATITERYCLCGAGSPKFTHHLTLSLKGSSITYTVGDSIGIFPTNDPELVAQTVRSMQATGSEIVLDRHAGNQWSLKEFLTMRANITEISRKLLNEVCFRQTNPSKKAQLEYLQAEENKDLLKEYLSSHHLWDILLAHTEVQFPPQELCNLLMPLLPRLYSIASSQNAVGDQVDLTIALLEYHTNGHPRRGVCTHFLCERAAMNVPAIPVYIQAQHGFTLPADPAAPMIMVGPGTGVAPFRAFMQERMHQNAPGKNWLFFGECHRKSNFFYEEYWQQHLQANQLRLDLAFSRDQDYKIYVQHRLLEHGAEIFDWLEKGAYFYVCGDAKHMAKDVEAALAEIIRQYGHQDEQGASQYIKRLRSEKRYLRDVY